MIDRWEKLLTQWVRSRSSLISAALFGTVLGMVFSFPGANTWDDLVQEGHTQWLLYRYGGLADPIEILPYDQLYGPLWSLILGLFQIPLTWLNDPSWIRHALTFALYPLGLIIFLRLLIRAGVETSTAILSCALVVGLVRLGGHALLNVKDFPHAMAFVAVSLYLWIFFNERWQATKMRLGSVDLLVLTAVSALPFLLRTPLLFHFLGSWCFLVGTALLVKQDWSAHDCIRILGLPWIFLILTAVIFFPVIWQAGPKPWIHMFIFFNQVYTDGSVRIFGHDYSSQLLPRWYSFVWIPIMANPVALLTASAGLIALPWRSLNAKAFLLPTRWGEWNLSLKLWLTIILVGAWSTVVVKSPRLYDEERHILFLYPLLFLLCGLGLDFLTKPIKYSLTFVIVGWSLAAFALWGPYSYIYKSPLLGNREASAFMGDYWGVCLNRLLPKLAQILPDTSLPVEIPMAMGVARQQQQRLETSLVFRQPDFKPLNLVDNSDASTYYYVLIQRQPYIRLNQLRGKVDLKEVYHQPMPPSGEAACVVYQATKQP